MITIALSPEQIEELVQGNSVRRTVGGYDNPLSLQSRQEQGCRKVGQLQNPP